MDDIVLYATAQSEPLTVDLGVGGIVWRPHG